MSEPKSSRSMPWNCLLYTSVELVGISYEEASQIVERSPLAEPVADAMGVAIFSHDLPYYWAMFFYYGNGYWLSLIHI